MPGVPALIVGRSSWCKRLDVSLHMISGLSCRYNHYMCSDSILSVCRISTSVEEMLHLESKKVNEWGLLVHFAGQLGPVACQEWRNRQILQGVTSCGPVATTEWFRRVFGPLCSGKCAEVSVASTQCVNRCLVHCDLPGSGLPLQPAGRGSVVVAVANETA